MHLCPLTHIFLLWWLSSYFCQEITPGPFPSNTTTTQQVHSLCSYNILHIWLHLPHNTVSTFFYVCCSNQNLNKCWIEIRLFIFTQTWPLISIPEPYSASILVFDSKYYWSAGGDAEFPQQWMTSWRTPPQKLRRLYLFFAWEVVGWSQSPEHSPLLSTWDKPIPCLGPSLFVSLLCYFSLSLSYPCSKRS